MRARPGLGQADMFGQAPAPAPKPKPARHQSPGAVRAAQARKADRAAHRAKGSPFARLDWSGTRCARCGHYCDERHHPGRSGACNHPGCNCCWATVKCQCRHDTADHEAFGEDTSTACHECGCLRFAAAP